MIDAKIINPFSLPSVSIDERDSLPKVAAIYFALSGEEILYIGKANCLRERWGSHHRMRNIAIFDNARIAWCPFGAGVNLAEIERVCIKHFNPRLNHAVIPEELVGTPGVSVRLPIGTQQHLMDIATRTGHDIETAFIIAVERFWNDVRQGK